MDGDVIGYDAEAAAAAVAVLLFFFLRRNLFDSNALSIAARRTDRFTDHATSARQARTARAIAPNAEPTAMKRVPSGVFDLRKYGAPSMGGTVTTGTWNDDVAAELSVLDNVGISVSEVSVGIAVSVVNDGIPVSVDREDPDDPEASEVSEGPDAVVNFGMSVSVVAAVGPSVGCVAALSAAVVAASTEVACAEVWDTMKMTRNNNSSRSEGRWPV